MARPNGGSAPAFQTKEWKDADGGLGQSGQGRPLGYTDEEVKVIPKQEQEAEEAHRRRLVGEEGALEDESNSGLSNEGKVKKLHRIERPVWARLHPSNPRSEQFNQKYDAQATRLLGKDVLADGSSLTPGDLDELITRVRAGDLKFSIFKGCVYKALWAHLSTTSAAMQADVIPPELQPETDMAELQPETDMTELTSFHGLPPGDIVKVAVPARKLDPALQIGDAHILASHAGDVIDKHRYYIFFKASSDLKGHGFAVYSFHHRGWSALTPEMQASGRWAVVQSGDQELAIPQRCSTLTKVRVDGLRMLDPCFVMTIPTEIILGKCSMRTKGNLRAEDHLVLLSAKDRLDYRMSQGFADAGREKYWANKNAAPPQPAAAPTMNAESAAETEDVDKTRDAVGGAQNVSNVTIQAGAGNISFFNGPANQTTISNGNVGRTDDTVSARPQIQIQPRAHEPSDPFPGSATNGNTNENGGAGRRYFGGSSTAQINDHLLDSTAPRGYDSYRPRGTNTELQDFGRLRYTDNTGTAGESRKRKDYSDHEDDERGGKRPYEGRGGGDGRTGRRALPQDSRPRDMDYIGRGGGGGDGRTSQLRDADYPSRGGGGGDGRTSRPRDMDYPGRGGGGGDGRTSRPRDMDYPGRGGGGGDGRTSRPRDVDHPGRGGGGGGGDGRTSRPRDADYPGRGDQRDADYPNRGGGGGGRR